MNKDLQEEEFDRELALKHGPSFMDCVIVKIGKKSLQFLANERKIHQDYVGRDERITFKKRSQDSALNICVEWNEFTYTTCNHGHTHQSSKMKREYKSFDIDWEYMNQLIEWIQLGSWTEVSGKEPTHKRVMKQCLDFLEQIEKLESSKIFLGEIKKLKTKLKDEI